MLQYRQCNSKCSIIVCVADIECNDCNSVSYDCNNSSKDCDNGGNDCNSEFAQQAIGGIIVTVAITTITIVTVVVAVNFRYW